MIEAAWSASRTHDTYLSSLYSRLVRRRGAKKTAVAVWHIFKHHVPYQDLGPSHFDKLHTERLTRHYLRRLEDLGLKVTVQDEAA